MRGVKAIKKEEVVPSMDRSLLGEHGGDEGHYRQALRGKREEHKGPT